MSKHTFTPGPWTVSPTDDTMVIGADRREVCTAAGDYHAPDDWPVMEANARLIAAAPDLLNALKDLIEAAEAAIAKAEGRS